MRGRRYPRTETGEPRGKPANRRLDTFHRADDYIAALQKLYPMVEKVYEKGTFGGGPDVGVLCDLHVKPPMPTMYVVEWYTVAGEKIGRVQVVFDPRPMAASAPR